MVVVCFDSFVGFEMQGRECLMQKIAATREGVAARYVGALNVAERLRICGLFP